MQKSDVHELKSLGNLILGFTAFNKWISAGFIIIAIGYSIVAFIERRQESKG